MSSLFGGKPNVPVVEDPEVEEARRRKRLAELRGRGKGSTILTPVGGGTLDPTLGKKTLLGE